MSAVLVQPGLAYMFGGVYDEEDNEEDLHGNFFNDLISLNVSKHQWHEVILNGKSNNAPRRRRRKVKEDGNEGESEEEEEGEEEMDSTPAAPTVITDEDGIFTVIISSWFYFHIHHFLNFVVDFFKLLE